MHSSARNLPDQSVERLTNNKSLSLGEGRKITGPKPAVSEPVSVEPPASAEVAREIKLSGVTKSGYPFDTLRTGQAVVLVKDPYGAVVKPDEGHPDPDALSVQDLGGRHIGYIPAAQAKVFANFWKLVPTMTLSARVHAITGGGDYHYGVRIMVLVNGLEDESA